MKKSLVRFVVLVLILALAVPSLTGCMGNVVNIPAGFVGMKLTPTGWSGEWLEAGQVDLGVKSTSGTYTSLVLLEVTSTTVLEQFVGSGELVGETTDTSDHRVLTQDGVPISVDVYVRMMVPADKTIRTAILAQVTPVHVDGDPSMVQRITVKQIYKQFASPEVRGSIRTLFASYANYAAVYKDFGKIPETLGQDLKTIFTANNVPLIPMAVSLSNVKPDETIWVAMNQVAAAQAQADAIAIVGKALTENPEYLKYMQWDYLYKIAQAGNNSTFIVDGSQSTSSSDYAAAQYLYDQLTAQTANSPTATVTPTPTKNP